MHWLKQINQTRVLYSFLSYRYSDTLSALSVLHSIIFQLASGSDELPDLLCQASRTDVKDSVSAAIDLFKLLLGCAGRTYVVVDGLDEMNVIERGLLLKQIVSASHACQDLKLLISSRAEDDIAEILRETATIRIDKWNTGSIRAFISQRTEEWFVRSRFQVEAQHEIRDLMAPLASKANGMTQHAWSASLNDILHKECSYTLK